MAARPVSITLNADKTAGRNKLFIHDTKPSPWDGFFIVPYSSLATFACMTIEQLYSLFQQYPSIQTDTRKLKQGDIFFALKGPNFNGNQFAQQALQAGAAYAVVDEKPAVPQERIIVVEDTLLTLQQLALHHRHNFQSLL